MAEPGRSSPAALLAGPALFGLLLAVPAPAGFPPAAWQVAALAPWLILAAVVASIILISEFASNVAVAAAFLPVVGALAAAGGGDVVALAIPAGLAASCAFMLPVGTPPNALAFSQGVLRVRDMARAGIYLNLLAWALLALVLPVLLRVLF